MTNVILDFNDLATGAIVADQFNSKGVSISSASSSNPPMIFDTANPTGGDRDLATDSAGKALIISEDGDSSDPDDNAGGGTLVFEFDSAAHVQSLNVIDFERGGCIRLYDENGDLIDTVEIGCTEDGGQLSVEIGVEGVYRMEVDFPSSGAIDDIAYSIDLPAEPDGIVEGTDGDDMIDLAYTGDPEGDMIDNGDAILPGEDAEDDIVWAGAGDDTVKGGEGDDEIWGDRAQVENDTVTITLENGASVTYPNKLFAYTIDPLTGEISNLEMLSDNALNDAGTSYEYEVAPGGIIGVGIYSPDGVFLSSGYGDNVDLNSDGLVHTKLVGVSSTGAVTIGFEDLKCLGDQDFDDVIVTVDLGNSGAAFDNAHVDYSSDFTGYDDTAAGDDTLDGGVGDDDIYGGGGNDTIIGGDGSDMADGGDGDDVIDTSSTGVPLPDRAFPGYGPIPAVPADSDPDDDKDTVFGGAGNDTITTGDDADYIDGGTGDDVIDGGIDDDTILGGDGADTIIGGEGSDDIQGGDGDDTIYGGLDPAFPDSLNIKDDGTDPYGPDPVPDNGKDVIDGGAGNDTIYGQDDDDLIYGGTGDDVIDAGIDDDEVYGGEGEDVILGGQGNDVLDGGADTDLISGGAGNDTIEGGMGGDLIGGGEGDDLIFGDDATNAGNTVGGGNDILFGGEGSDEIFGGGGDDVIVGGEGGDYQEGGSGDDLFVDVDGGDHVDGGDGNDTLVLSGPAIIDYDDDTKTSGTINFLNFGDGEVSTETATFENIEELTYVIPEGDPTPVATTTTSTISDINDLPATDDPTPTPGIVDGTTGGDLMDGTYVDADGDQIDDGVSLPGLGGNDDVVYGYGGADDIRSGTGNDVVAAGDGNDVVDGGEGDDLILGQDGNDTLLGFDGDDRISGGDGDDIVSGLDGDDVLVGGQGSDVVNGGDGNDVLSGGDASAVDDPDTDPSDDELLGGAGSDILYGDAGNDSIDLGDDTDLDLAFGGADADTFTGVSWSDTPNPLGLTGDVIVGGETGDDDDTIDLTGQGPLRVLWENDDPTTESGVIEFLDSPGGNVLGTATFREIENVIPCFMPGSRVATPSGEKLVEELCVGDKVLTRDNGVQEIRWYGQKRLDYGKLSKVPHLQPILIPAGSLGGGLPERDMMVSPNHRMLVADDRTSLYFAEHEVLVAAKHLEGRQGIRRMPQMQATYIHFMFDRHEVVLADGAWTESFQPGDYSLAGIDTEQRDEILEIFPELATVQGRDDYVAARRTLKKHEALLLQQ